MDVIRIKGLLRLKLRKKMISYFSFFIFSLFILFLFFFLTLTLILARFIMKEREFYFQNVIVVPTGASNNKYGISLEI